MQYCLGFIINQIFICNSWTVPLNMEEQLRDWPGHDGLDWPGHSGVHLYFCSVFFFSRLRLFIAFAFVVA